MESHYEGKAHKFNRFPDGTMEFFDGPAESEKLVRVEHADGRVEYFTGERNKERRTHSKLPNGDVEHYDYDGLVTRVECKRTGTVKHYKGLPPGPVLNCGGGCGGRGCHRCQSWCGAKIS